MEMEMVKSDLHVATTVLAATTDGALDLLVFGTGISVVAVAVAVAVSVAIASGNCHRHRHLRNAFHFHYDAVSFCH